MKKLITFIVFVAIAGAAYAGWRYVRSGSEAKEEKYRTATIDEGEVAMTITASGTLSAVTTVQVGSQVSGVIAALYADFNSRVTKGQLLAELDPAPFEAQVEQRQADLRRAEVDLRNSEISLTRQRRLVDQGLASQAELDSAQAIFDMGRAQVSQSKAALDQAMSNLGYTKIRSPINGIVVDRQYDVGQTVAASFQAPTLFQIAEDLTRMQVQADVDQADIGRVAVGQPVTFNVDAYPTMVFPGAVAQIRLNATVNQTVVTYPVIIEVDNSDERLRPQMTANVTIEVAHVDDVLRVPNGALRFKPETPEENKADAANGRPSGSFERNAAAMGEGRGMVGASRAFDAATRKGGRGKTQTVYLLHGTVLKPVEVRTGITDGRFTQVIEGELKVGDIVVVGAATAKASDARGPGMGRGRF